MKKLLVVASMFLLTLVLANAAARAEDKVKLSGYVIDNMCGGEHAKDANVEEVVKHHQRSCALMPACTGSGYAVYANGKLYKLDEGGSKKVLAILKSTKSGRGLAVDVEGTVDGDTLTVASISESPKKAEMPKK